VNLTRNEKYQIRRRKPENREKENARRRKPERRIKESIRRRKPENRGKQRTRIKTDPQFKLKYRMRSRLRSALISIRIKKEKRTIEYLGCSISFLKDYLNCLLEPGWTWDNYGKMWHIDHIRPCQSFILTREEHRQKCFHYSNLQPLKGQENIRKSSLWKGWYWSKGKPVRRVEGISW